MCASKRQVGTVLKHLPDAGSGLPYHGENVPWQRVINAKGTISPRYECLCCWTLRRLTSKRAAGEAENQANALRAEGVDVREIEGLGGWAISLGEFGWFPEALSDD